MLRKVRAGYTLYHKTQPFKGPVEVDLPDDVAKSFEHILEPLGGPVPQAPAKTPSPPAAAEEADEPEPVTEHKETKGRRR